MAPSLVSGTIPRPQYEPANMFRRTSVLLLALPLVATAFVAPSSLSRTVAGDCQSASCVLLQQRQISSSSTQPSSSWSATQSAIYSSSNDDEDAVPTSRRRRKAAGLDPEMRSKLLSESIAPWRTVRLFLYVAAGSGALLGGLITLSGVAAALSGARTDVDLNTEVCDVIWVTGVGGCRSRHCM